MTIYYSAHARYSTLPPEPEGFRILHVCVANQRRSPMAERITRHELARRLGGNHERWAVTSAGTKGTNGQPMHKYSLRALTTMGVNAENFRSRQLTETIALEADLILAATGYERDFVISKVPATLPTAFTLREFARLVSALPAPEEQQPGARPPGLPLQTGSTAGSSGSASLDSAARATVAAARKLRGRVPYVEPSLDDLTDPPRTAAAFDHCASEILSAVNTILTRLVTLAGPTGAEMAAGRR